MFYEGQDKQGKHSIGLATGHGGGLQWRRQAQEPVFAPSQDAAAWDGKAVSRPWVVPMDNGSARLYYLGRSKEGMQAIGVAESHGRDWTRWIRV